VGILVTFVPPKVTARRGMSDMPTLWHSGWQSAAQRNTAANAKAKATAWHSDNAKHTTNR